MDGASGNTAAEKDIFTKMMDISWWIPSMHEMFLYIVVILLLYLFSALVYYNGVQMRVTQESVCYKDKQSIQNNGTYTVTANNQNNLPLYRVGYNLAAKSFSVECACTPGNVTNTFTNIDVYNLNTNQIQTIPSKLCSCDRQLYTPSTDRIYYSGYPGVLRFMNSAALHDSMADKQAKSDTTFFTGKTP